MPGDLDLIRKAAVEGGEVALKARRRGLTIDYKSADNTPVTDADLAVDLFLKDALLGARPDYGWLSEETVDDPSRLAESLLFVVDPIDGTRAFMNGKPWFTVCIAVVRDGRPVAAVVHAPELGETYEAVLGGGARLNGAPIRASQTDDLAGCAMIGDARLFSERAWAEPWPAMRIESRNSVAYRMALVASGAADATVALSPKSDWDIAAADLIVLEAGGLVTDHRGEQFRYNQPVPRQPSLVCGAPAVHPLLLARVRSRNA